MSRQHVNVVPTYRVGTLPLALPLVFAGLTAVASLPVQGQDASSELDRLLAQSHQNAAQVSQGEGALGEALQTARSQAGGTGLPNGASSISETFSDWTVNCATQNQQKICAMSQAQGDSQTGQQLFAVELYGTQDGRSEGILVLPFGLDLRSQVSLAVGDQPLGAGAVFTTCMPSGCVVPVSFSQPELEALKRGTTASVTARSASGTGEEAQFVISLAGFTAATDRVDQLLR